MSQPDPPPIQAEEPAPAPPTPSAAIEFRIDRIYRLLIEQSQRAAALELSLLQKLRGSDRQIESRLRDVERMILINDRRLDIIEAEANGAGGA